MFSVLDLNFPRPRSDHEHSRGQQRQQRRRRKRDERRRTVLFPAALQQRHRLSTRGVLQEVLQARWARRGLRKDLPHNVSWKLLHFFKYFVAPKIE